MRRVSTGIVSAVFVALFLALTTVPSSAADNTAYNLPWEKFNLQAGVFFAGLNNQVTVGAPGAGVAIDVESLLGLNVQNTVFRAGAAYRIGSQRRHRLDLDYLYFNRSGDKTIGQDIEVDNTVISAGTRVQTKYNFQILRLGYSYSFFQDDRMDLGVGIGIFVMPLKFELSASGLGSGQGELKFTAPLPAVALRGDFAITKRWFLRTNVDFFYLEYQSFTGYLVDTRLAVEYNPWQHFGLGLGVDNFRMVLTRDGNSDYPGVDFQGDIKNQFLGVQLYARYFF